MESLTPVLSTIIFVLTLQAIVLSVLILLKRPRRPSNSFLALLVFFFALMSMNIALVFVMRDYDIFYAFRYVQLELLFGIGPALYFYTRSITDPTFRFSGKDWIHFVPVVLEFIFYRTSLYRLGAEGMYQTPVHPFTKYYLAEQWLGILSISIYTFLSLRTLYRHNRWLKQQYSNLDKRSLNWLRTPVLFFSGFWIGWNLLTELDRFVFDRALRQWYFLPAFVGLAIATYWIGFMGYVRTQTGIPGYRDSDAKASAGKRSVHAGDAERIRELMASGKPYLNPELDLATLAGYLGMPPKQVSATINQYFGQNFYEFVNGYRVKAFKKRVAMPDSGNLTLLGHALECGFNSKSTFNDVFKKTAGKTPSQFVRDQKKRSEGKHSDA